MIGKGDNSLKPQQCVTAKLVSCSLKYNADEALAKG